MMQTQWFTWARGYPAALSAAVVLAMLAAGCGSGGSGNSSPPASNTAVACTPVPEGSTASSALAVGNQIVSAKFITGAEALPEIVTDSGFVLPLKTAQDPVGVLIDVRRGTVIRAPFHGYAEEQGQLSLQYMPTVYFPPPAGSPGIMIMAFPQDTQVAWRASVLAGTGVTELQTNATLGNYKWPSADFQLPPGSPWVKTGEVLATVVHPVELLVATQQMFPGMDYFIDAPAILPRYFPAVSSRPAVPAGDVLLSSPDLNGEAELYAGQTALGRCRFSLWGYAAVRSSAVRGAGHLTVRGTEPWGPWAESCMSQAGLCALSPDRAEVLTLIDAAGKTINEADALHAADAARADFSPELRSYVPKSPAYGQIDAETKSAKPTSETYQGLSFMRLAELVALSDGSPGVALADTERYTTGGKPQSEDRTYFMQYDAKTRHWLIEDVHQSWVAVPPGPSGLTMAPPGQTN